MYDRVEAESNHVHRVLKERFSMRRMIEKQQKQANTHTERYIQAAA